jgi:hypothetical protein
MFRVTFSRLTVKQLKDELLVMIGERIALLRISLSSHTINGACRTVRGGKSLVG